MLPCFLLCSVCSAQPCHRCLGERFCIKTKKSQIPLRLDFERKTRVCPPALYSVYQAVASAQYYTPNSRDTWVVSRCRFRVRLLPYKLQNYSCLRQIYEKFLNWQNRREMASICSYLSSVYWTLALAFALLLRLWAIMFCSISSLLLIVWARRQRLISAIW